MLIFGLINCIDDIINFFEDILLYGYPTIGHDLLHFLPPIVEILVQIRYYFLYYVPKLSKTYTAFFIGRGSNAHEVLASLY